MPTATALLALIPSVNALYDRLLIVIRVVVDLEHDVVDDSGLPAGEHTQCRHRCKTTAVR